MNTSGGGGSAKVLTSPAVRKLGRENGINLGTVMGTGPGGRVLKADVLRIINPASLLSLPLSLYTSAPAPPLLSTSPRTTDMANAMREAGTPGGGGAVVPIGGYHRLMVKTMTLSLRVPHMV
jgi:pyruvate/2-oxoglutarate dehydrogenase complex dihydrolipoamide acyltransferase (E2) component